MSLRSSSRFRFSLVAGVIAALPLAAACDGGKREREMRDAGPELPQQPDAPFYPDLPTGDDRPKQACSVDVLFVIDNSNSMIEEQMNLTKQFPAMIAALRELPGGLPDIHIGVVSTDMGTGMHVGVPGCKAGGDKGVLRAEPRVAGCMPPRPADRFLAATAEGGGNNFDGKLEDAFSCIASLGVGGCGLENQFGAMRAALDGRNPENAGFLRPLADLAVVFITDEDDCTAPATSDLYSTDATASACGMLGPLDSYRCTQFGVKCDSGPVPAACSTEMAELTGCHSAEDESKLETVASHIAFLKTLKEGTASHVIVAALTGPAEPFKVTNALGKTSLEPSCNSPVTGNAAPAVRLRDLVEAFGDRGLIEPICAEDFGPAMRKIGELIRTSLGTLGSC